MKSWDSVTNLIVDIQGREARRALQVHDLDELSTKIGVHRRDQASWLNAVFNDAGGQSNSFGI